MMTAGRETYGREWNRLRRKVYAGKRWKMARRVALDAAGWRCSTCGRAGRLEVHHIRRVSEDVDGAGWYEQSNLRVLCRDCHFATHRPEKREAGRAHMAAERREWRAVIDGITDRKDGGGGRNAG